MCKRETFLFHLRVNHHSVSCVSSSKWNMRLELLVLDRIRRIFVSFLNRHIGGELSMMALVVQFERLVVFGGMFGQQQIVMSGRGGQPQHTEKKGEHHGGMLSIAVN